MAKVLCFIGELTVEFQADLIRNLITVAGEHGHEMLFCVNFDTNGLNAMYCEIEKKIINLPDLKNYDGIIVCPDTYAIDGMAEELSDKIARDADCPVISVRVSDDKFYSIELSDYQAMYNMVEHFIEVHNFSRICFMTGRMDLEDAHRRLAGYKDCMEKHGFEITDGMVFEGDYWREKGGLAVDYFLANNDEVPQAIVCSNDYMAISVCNALVERGFRIPEDVCVSGLDDIEETRYHLPPITSIKADTMIISEKAFEIFNNHWNGIEMEKKQILPLQAQMRNSCGCCKEVDFSMFQNMYKAKEQYLSALHFCPYLNLDFEAADTFVDLMYSVHMMLVNKSYGSPGDFGTLYFCLCDESERQDNMAEMASKFTDNMVLRAMISAGSLDANMNEKFPRSIILPPEYSNPDLQTYIFMLHCKDVCYGYLVLQNDDITKIQQLIKTIVFSIGSALDRINMFTENQDIQKLREQSYIDEMTQIANRRSMERYIRKLYERLERTNESFCIMSVDMDGLKYTNDTFGHMEGDFAISNIAKILDESKPVHGLAARVGGDEFTVLFPSCNAQDAENTIKTINSRVEQFNAVSNKPYPLSVSIGYEYCEKGMDMLACMHQADKKMYEIKVAKKKNRR